MKQNIYDHPDFFEGYKDLRDNDKGLNELLEQPAIKCLMKPVQGKIVVDLGCGLGHQVESILSQSPKKIIGVDISKKMLAEAKKRISSPSVQWVCQAVEEYEFGKEKLDLVLSSMTLHYIANLKMVFKKIYAGLKPGGQFLFSIEHPSCTAILESLNRMQTIPNYAIENQRKQDWFIKDVVKYHRKLSTIVQEVLEVGFILKNLKEPTPDTRLLRQRTDFEKHIQHPPILILDTLKPLS
ncbi:putative methyltransferase [Chryseobacterium sp. StRB126]|uniref:class I SAM-dependent methyltransferase n=1 Tax=Chryseobacterium sp. StRB126 TaxID=878220 RepID=UPI0004E98A39|nr:class I SAM-dependent methyltransferase [Chryseobacterium sp. StRB126]BAP32366.1 putative methyltransferase [Chryseobacterium sp. StRB126]